MICSPDVVTSGQQAPTVIDAYYLVGFLAERFRVVFTGARAACDDADGVGFFPANSAAGSTVRSMTSPRWGAWPNEINGWVT